MANTSILAAFERMWQHVAAALSTKSDISHNHNDLYYTDEEVDTKLAAKADKTHNHDSAYDTKGAANSALASAKSYTDTKFSNIPSVDAYTKSEIDAAFDEIDEVIDSKADASHTHSISNVTNLQSSLDAKVPTSRTVNGKALSANISLTASDVGAASSSHNHNDLYYTETEVDTKLASKADKTHNHDADYDAKGSASAVQENLNAVGDTIDAHIDNADIHVTTTNKSNWNTAYTHSQATHARTDATKVADSSTNGNILINGTETNVYTHPNSGVTAGTYKSVTVNAQGHITGGSNPTTLSGYGITDAESKGAATAALASAKEYTDTVASGKSDSGHNHDSDYDTKGAASSALASAKEYADSAATTASNKVKNDLLNGAGAAYDTLKELGDLIVDNQDAIDALETVAAGKADKTHGHAIADVSGLQTALDGKAASSHGTHVSFDSTNKPKMDGTAAFGTSSKVARADHVHPTDTSRAAKTDLDSHTSNTTVHVTSTERSNWNAAKSHADSAHAPSNAEKNQNAFSNVTVGSTTIAADSTTDTLTLVAGTNVTITPDATNDKITISATDTNTTYSAGTGISLSGTTFSNSGVRSISTGSANGTISVNTNGTSADVAVKGLGSAAYKATSAFDAAGAANTALTNAKTYTDTVAEGKADKSQAVFYVEGSGTTDTTNKVATWTGSHSDISEYYAGLMIAYKVGTAGSTTTTLNINNLGAVNVVKNATTAVSTSFPVNSVVLLVYTVDGTTAYWKAHDYDANTRNTVGDYQKNGTKLYFVGTTTTDSATSSSYATSYTNSNIYVDTSNVLNSAKGFKGKLVGNADTATSATSATKATQDASGNTITSTYETKTDANSKLTEAKTYTDTVASGKANTSHSHAISDVSGLQTALDGKAASSHGTHVSFSSTAPVMDGTASVGSASTVARSDHKHPTDTSRASKTEFNTHTGNTTVHITSTERTNWNAAKTHADSAHAPSNAQANQNAFSNIKVGSTTIAADTTTDTLELVGSNVTITPDATNDKVTFSVANGSTSAKGVVKLTNSTSSTSTTTAATPSSVKSAYDLANTAKTNAATAQTRADSAYTLAESKVDSLSDLGITATATELNYVDGVTSSIQTQLNGKATSGHTHSNVSLGQGYATCSTAASTTAKTASLSNYELTTGGVVSVRFTYSVPASATLNINSKGAKSIYYKNTAIVANVIKGGDTATFIFDGTRYHLITVDRWHGDIVSLKSNDSKVRQMPSTANGNFRLLLTPSSQSADTTAYTYFDNDVYLNPYYNKIYGVDISGNAGSADKATHDASGNVITSTYATKAELTNLVGDTKVSTQIANAIVGKSDTGHNHSASAITSGTLPVARGGTGASTVINAWNNLGFKTLTSAGTLTRDTTNTTADYWSSSYAIVRGFAYVSVNFTLSGAVSKPYTEYAVAHGLPVSIASYNRAFPLVAHDGTAIKATVDTNGTLTVYSGTINPSGWYFEGMLMYPIIDTSLLA